MTERLDPALVKHIRSKGIRVEQLDTVSDEKIGYYPLMKDAYKRSIPDSVNKTKGPLNDAYMIKNRKGCAEM